MAYSEAVDSGRGYGGEHVSRPLDGHPNPGMGELRKKLGSMELAPSVESPNQVKELVDIIEAAESTIRTQVEESEQLRFALQAAEWELHTYKLEQQKQGAPEAYHASSQLPHGRNSSFRTPGLKEGQAGITPPLQYQSGPAPLTGATSYAQHNGLSNGSGNVAASRNAIAGARPNGPSATDSGSFSNAASSSGSPRIRRRDPETDLRRDLYPGQVLPLDVPDSNNHSGYHRSQDMMVRISRTPEDEESNEVQLKGRLVDASVKEAQLVSEKRILERRVAELRLAYDQQQQGLVDAASKALSYRQNILEENIRLTYALQVAEQERTTYVQNLMPLLAEFDLQPPVSDAHSMVSHIKILVQKLRSELELYEGKVKDAQFYPPSYQPSYQPTSSYNPPPQSPPYQGHGLEIVPSYSQRPTSPAQQLRNGRPSWESGNSSPHYAGMREDNLHNAGSNDQEAHADARAIVPHESVNSTANEGLDDLEGDETPYNNGSHTLGDSGLNRSEVVRSPPQLPPLPEEPTSPSFEDSDPLPGIVGLRIVGDAILSGRLTACGHSINGTSLCIFQWVRHYQNGTASYIEGAAQPEYTITADDCDSMVAIECVPMDERGRRGDLVTVMANDGNWITREPMMQDQIDSYMANGQASFEVNLLEGTSEDMSEPATLVLRRSAYELRRNNGRKLLVNEKYAPDVSIKIPVGELLQCAITSHDGRQNYLELRDPRMRDMAVLTFRAFHKAAIDEQKKKTRRKWLRG